ncbi:hypothetical protein SAMN02927924_02881 [Sphingobium faniae]|uniref:Uncharacterized protein n=2 Tax=Sphingobium TaxID=165695 RepID=A0A0S3EZ11_9SPHN|nr:MULTISPECIES: hypothetical protein [Sphingobium]ALR20657.1 hypothetical protein ATN00_10440 [Sphingobium baderi]WDA38406.1 hypothetical protein PO876_09605 [Sphingobium sp. YC-XJ3]SCW79342.1 hypothetical protein SAMN02927924_02881 [Sphingobium faniae]
MFDRSSAGQPLSANHAGNRTKPRHDLLLAYRTLIEETPGHVLIFAIAFIASQAGLLVSLLLPWKILIILGSGRISQLLPSFLRHYERDELVALLGGAALGFFLFHLGMETLIRRIYRSGADHICRQHRKVGLFDRHHDHAVRYYRYLLHLLGLILCIVLVIIWLAHTYPLLLLALLTFCGAGSIAVRYGASSELGSQRSLSPEIASKLWSGGAFLYVISWVAIDLWRGTVPHLTIIFISVLLARQALIFCAVAYRLLDTLTSQSERLRVLFDSEAPWYPKVKSADGFHALLINVEIRRWLAPLSKQYDPAFPAAVNPEFRAVENGKLIYATVRSAPEGEQRPFLVKLFHHSLQSLAEHERELLAVSADHWPAPPFLGMHDVDRHRATMFRLEQDFRWLEPKEKAAILPTLRQQLLACDLPADLIERYDRGSPRLAERLAIIDWRYLRLFITEGEASRSIDKIHEYWPSILDGVDRLPRQLVLPGLEKRLVGVAQESPVICNWARWRWEPVGAGWPQGRNSEQRIKAALSFAGEIRPEIRAIAPERACYAALLYELERFYAVRDGSGAQSLIPHIANGAEHFCNKASRCLNTVDVSNAASDDSNVVIFPVEQWNVPSRSQH